MECPWSEAIKSEVPDTGTETGPTEEQGCEEGDGHSAEEDGTSSSMHHHGNYMY